MRLLRAASAICSRSAAFDMLFSSATATKRRILTRSIALMRYIIAQPPCAAVERWARRFRGANDSFPNTNCDDSDCGLPLAPSLWRTPAGMARLLREKDVISLL